MEVQKSEKKAGVKIGHGVDNRPVPGWDFRSHGCVGRRMNWSDILYLKM